MPNIPMDATIVPPGGWARITGRLTRLPDKDFMVHAGREQQLTVVRQVLEEWCSGPREGEVLAHVEVRNTCDVPLVFDRLGIDL